MGFPGNAMTLEERRAGVSDSCGGYVVGFLLGTLVILILSYMKKSVGEEYNMNNEDTHNFFVNLI